MNDNDLPQENDGNKRLKEGLSKPNDVELRYRSLFEQSPDGILIIDTDGTILDFNRTAHSMLGYTREEFEKIHISRLSVQKPAEIQECIERLLRSGKAEFEARYKTKSGRVDQEYLCQFNHDVAVRKNRNAFHLAGHHGVEKDRGEPAEK